MPALPPLVLTSRAAAMSCQPGRTLVSTAKAPGSMEEAAVDINSHAELAGNGGSCVPVVCDHANDDATAALFQRVAAEQDGRLDVLVNNAYAGVNAIMETAANPETGRAAKFWEKELWTWDASHNVGLRCHYVCSVFAAKMFVARGGEGGLIVNVSSFGGLQYAAFANDIAYGVGKAALDRLGNDMAVQLERFGVPVITLWPGAVKTELIEQRAGGGFGEHAETTQYSGLACVALATHLEDAMAMTGKVVLTTELAEQVCSGRAPTRIDRRSATEQWLIYLMAVCSTCLMLECMVERAELNCVLFCRIFRAVPCCLLAATTAADLLMLICCSLASAMWMATIRNLIHLTCVQICMHPRHTGWSVHRILST